MELLEKFELATMKADDDQLSPAAASSFFQATDKIRTAAQRKDELADVSVYRDIYIYVCCMGVYELYIRGIDHYF